MSGSLLKTISARMIMTFLRNSILRNFKHSIKRNINNLLGNQANLLSYCVLAIPNAVHTETFPCRWRIYNDIAIELSSSRTPAIFTIAQNQQCQHRNTTMAVSKRQKLQFSIRKFSLHLRCCIICANHLWTRSSIDSSSWSPPFNPKKKTISHGSVVGSSSG